MSDLAITEAKEQFDAMMDAGAARSLMHMRDHLKETKFYEVILGSRDFSGDLLEKWAVSVVVFLHVVRAS